MARESSRYNMAPNSQPKIDEQIFSHETCAREIAELQDNIQILMDAQYYSDLELIEIRRKYDELLIKQDEQCLQAIDAEEMKSKVKQYEAEVWQLRIEKDLADLQMSDTDLNSSTTSGNKFYETLKLENAGLKQKMKLQEEELNMIRAELVDKAKTVVAADRQVAKSVIEKEYLRRQVSHIEQRYAERSVQHRIEMQEQNSRLTNMQEVLIPDGLRQLWRTHRTVIAELFSMQVDGRVSIQPIRLTPAKRDRGETDIACMFMFFTDLVSRTTKPTMLLERSIELTSAFPYTIHNMIFGNMLLLALNRAAHTFTDPDDNDAAHLLQDTVLRLKPFAPKIPLPPPSTTLGQALADVIQKTDYTAAHSLAPEKMLKASFCHDDRIVSAYRFNFFLEPSYMVYWCYGDVTLVWDAFYRVDSLSANQYRFQKIDEANGVIHEHSFALNAEQKWRLHAMVPKGIMQQKKQSFEDILRKRTEWKRSQIELRHW